MYNLKNAKNDIEKNVDISLELCVKVKIMKKSMSISLGTYDKKGGGRTFQNCCGGREKQILIIFLNITLVL